MPKVIPPLTDTQCKKLRYNPTEKSANRLRDGRGLILEARSSGRKVWLLEYKLGKKRSYATMPYDYGTERGPLAAARQWREQQQTLVAEGIDPNEYSKRQRANRLAESDRLFKAVSEEWIAHKEDSGKWGLKQQKKVTGIVRNHLQPVIGERPIAEITTPELLAVLQGIKSKGNAKLARQYAAAIFRRAISVRGFRHDDPTLPLGGQLATPESKEHPHLENAGEFGALLRDIDSYQASNFAVEFILKLSPLLFLRPTELRQAKWNEFDFQNAEWVIPKERMKIGKPLIVPISKQVKVLLEELATYCRHGEDCYLFPSPMNTKQPISDTPVRKALKSLDYTDADGRLIVPHGFRHTASTLLAESGQFPERVIETQLSHVEKNQVKATYNKAVYIKQRRELMQYWSDYCDRLKSGRTNVLEFKKSK